jgi:hypothetical protein
MPETSKTPFFHTDHFNCWMITSFFLVFTVILFAFLPVVGAHRVGVAVGDELSRYGEPAKPATEAPRPEPPRLPIEEGIPVAFQSAGTGP